LKCQEETKGQSAIKVKFKRKEEPGAMFTISFRDFFANDWYANRFIIPLNPIKNQTIISYKDNYRPSHADYVHEKKYGVDYRGGGRSL
jgi:hypothetical protein